MTIREHETWFLRGGGAEAIKGFLSPASSQVISRLLTYQLDQDLRGGLVEIGTYMGKTFIGMIMASREGEKVLGFDLFPDEVMAGFRRALGALDPRFLSRVVAIKRNTLTLPTHEWISILQKPARFIHIDGGHNFRTIINDLHLASSHLTDRAIVIIDDFLHDWYPDLTEGIISGLRASRNIVPIAVIPRIAALRDGGTKLVCAASEGADEYRSFLETAFHSKGIGKRHLAGHDVLTFQKWDDSI